MVSDSIKQHENSINVQDGAQLLSYCFKQCDSIINELSEQINSPSKKLTQSIKYTLLSGGKRLRPAMLLATFLALQKSESRGISKQAQYLAFALELLHTYTLIHDDLPAMDNDNIRRGKPSNHIVFGEDYALLAGDGLLNLSIEYALKSQCYTACGYLFNASGTEGTIGGQAYECDTKDTGDIASYLSIVELKTARLFQCALVMGAMCLDTDSNTLDMLKRLGLSFGILFQLCDDYHDMDKNSLFTKLPVEQVLAILCNYKSQALEYAQILNLSFIPPLIESITAGIALG